MDVTHDPNAPLTHELAALAESQGLQTSYVDIHGTRQQASGHRVVQILRALGGLGEDETPGQALHRTRIEQWNEILPPVVVAWNGEGHMLLRVPEHVTGQFRLSITTEQGDVIHRDGHLESLPVGEHLEGAAMLGRHLSLPTGLATGYHQAVLEASGGLRAQTLVLSAPRRVYAPTTDGRTWGLFAPLYALHSRRSAGAGDFTDLREVIEWVSERGGSVVGTLPMLAAYLDEPCEASPYAPWNEMYLDVQAIPEYRGCAQARRAFTDADALSTAKRLASQAKVDHKAQMALKRRALAPMAEQCWQQGGPRLQALEAFAQERPELVDYARFRAATERYGTLWANWPAPARDGTLAQRDVDPQAYRYHLYVQWNAHLQLEALARRARDAGLGLYLDLPVGVHGGGFDTWRHREAFAGGLSTGAPPDSLFEGGQNWAFPPLHPHRLRQSGYRHFIDVLRNHLRYAGVLRIDHVMGLHRIYAIVDGASATEGTYIRYQPDEMYALLSIESHRSQTVLLGENLGTVPFEVTQAMAEHGVHGMHVVQYAARPDPEAALPQPGHGDVASLNTHDMPPFRSFWEGTDIDLRADLGWLDEHAVRHQKDERKRLGRALTRYLEKEEDVPPSASGQAVMRALLRTMGRSEARLVLVNLEDLLGETHAQNVPGTYREHDNWQHRIRMPFETWRELPEVTEPLAELHRARDSHRRRAEVRYDVTRLGEQDLHLFNEGTHRRLDDVLGAHPMIVDDQDGTYFAVWAPSADYVSVVGDFNHWDRGRCPLRPRGESGVWEGFVAGVHVGDLYKFHVAGPGYNSERADPMGFRFEVPPRTASVVAKLDYDWHDEAWLQRRADEVAQHRPMSVYEVHLGSWMRVPEEGNRYLTYEDLASRLIDHVRALGFTHVELLPVMEHPFYGSWGYQSTGYFAPTSRYGSPRQLMALIDALHQAGIGVILDWVPSHFPSDEHALARFDGTHLYEHADPRKGYHPDWHSCIFNYGRYEVQSFLVSSARYWLDRYHADGLRVDAVASMLYLDYSRDEGGWIPNEYGGRENLEAIAFLRRLNESLYQSNPGIQTTAEESTAWPMVSRPTYVGGLGFGFKWDMGWMHDTLQYFSRDPVHRGFHHGDLTFRMVYAYNENFVLPLSHDEVVHGKGSLLGKMPGDRWQKFANLRALYGYMYAQPGKKLLFMGSEIGQEREWNHETSLDWHLLQDGMHAGVQRWVTDLNRLHREIPALHELDCDPDGFEWIDFTDAANSVYIFLRKARQGAPVLVVCNFTPVPREHYRVGVPHGGAWIELANSDAAEYAGSGMGNGGRVEAQPHEAHGRSWSLSLVLPPMSVLFLQPEGSH